MASGASVDARAILVGVDFSAGSETALDWATGAAIAFGAPLIVLHVVHDPAERPGYYVRPGEKERRELEKVAQDMMREFMAAAMERSPDLAEVPHLQTRVVVGLPVARILEVADLEGARLIAMGGQGRTALADALLGSKVERVTRLSPIPVTVVKSRGTGPETEARE